MNEFDACVSLKYTSTGDDPDTFEATGTVSSIREFCDWLDACLRDLSEDAFVG